MTAPHIIAVYCLKLAQRKGHDRVIILSDSLAVIQAIQGSNFAISNSALIRHIKNILSQERFWSLRYTPREQNAVADRLAREALISRVNLEFVDHPPQMVLNLLEMDQARGLFEQMCSTF
ncbi:hypothetical protein J1N35_026902 [Gossypium stocksii]|uniref:RNase H type-1 domain-containing protein n=1 Tax=Gossypium stocksii TaxID=47602 RepID=A0A9D3V9C1_9ROSI|nr:hypothetical protein J1N35_026902 [Gossypium stocksii]